MNRRKDLVYKTLLFILLLAFLCIPSYTIYKRFAYPELTKIELIKEIMGLR